MLWRQFCLGDNLPIHINENTDFLRQKPWQLLSSEVNFEGRDLDIVQFIETRDMHDYKLCIWHHRGGE